MRCEVQRCNEYPSSQIISVPVELDPDTSATSILGFRFLGRDFAPIPVIPHWFAITAVAMVGFLSGGRQMQFSLRTLLIATTLIAIVLRAIVYLLA